MRMRLLVCGVLVLAELATSACRPEKDATSASSDARATIPAHAASITGIVTDVRPEGRIRIEEQPGESAGSAKAVVRLSDDVTILHRAGSPATLDEIRNGMRVSAWFSGPVMESYPVQATANMIVIESGNP